jgi:uncharacterized protein YukJ
MGPQEAPQEVPKLTYGLMPSHQRRLETFIGRKALREEKLRPVLRESEAGEDEELRELKRKFAQMLMEEARRYYGSDF